MTMDIQKVNRSESLSPELKMSLTHSGEESMKSHEQYQTKVDNQFTGCNPGRSNKRSFDVAFLMMPDEKMKQKQMEKHLRISKQLFHESQYSGSRTEADNLRRSQEYLNKTQIYVHNDIDDSKGTDLTTSSCYNEKYRHNNNVSPQSNQDTNIDVGTDEFATKSVLSDSDVSDMSRSRPNSTESFSRPVRIVHDPMCRNTIYDDPTLNLPARPTIENSEKYIAARLSDLNQRSAFTKVTNSFQANNTLPQPAPSPGHSESPDNLSYQNSMSPPLTASSPPMMNNIFNKSSPFKSLIPSNHPLSSAFFKSQGPYQNYSDHQVSPHGNSDSSQYSKGSPPAYASSDKSMDAEKPQAYSAASKFGNFLPFRPDLPRYLQANSGYPFHMQNFHQGGNDFLKFPQQTEVMNPLIRNPAAAILSTLLPPTLATLSLPSQNICAKCNISFRMTSDLVYHMRSHHKSEVNYDTNRRKREEKLKCPVCAESFRERHHLTRHMTAHQDKEGDILDHQLDSSESNGAYKGKSRSYYPHTNGMSSK